MAKRKRLTPLPRGQDDPTTGAAETLETKGMFPLGVARGPSPGASPASPIARVAGEASATAALEELAGEVARARVEGRLVQALPLEAVEVGYLVRDRMLAGEDELAQLAESLRARGQQTPIEVVDLGQGRFGLISGWRRLTALRRLHEETGEARFATVQALLRRPETAAEAYLAMVEENEVRVGLSYYERARIVVKAAEQGVYPGEAEALRGLFAAASRARRSKIGAFLPICHALDGRLAFPAAIPERLGLQLSKALAADPGLGPRLAERLRKAAPATAEAELAVLARAAAPTGGAVASPAAGPVPSSPAPSPALPPAAAPGPAGITLTDDGPDGLRLAGPGVTPAFRDKLRAWLARQT